MVETEFNLREAVKECFWEEVTLKEEKRYMYLIRKVMAPKVEGQGLEQNSTIRWSWEECV